MSKNSDSERKYEGSNAQWLREQNMCDVLTKAQWRYHEGLKHGTDSGCILDYIFGENAESSCYDEDEKEKTCKDCIAEFLYKKHGGREV